MPTFIKTGYWDKVAKGYKGWLNLNELFIGGSGTGSAGQIAFYNSSNTITGSNNLFWDSINNRLGIGTNIPTNRLDVVGNIGLNTSGQSAVISTFYPTGTDGKNIYIGNGGLLGSGTGAESSYNVALGVDALLNQTTGAYNVALGWEAGKNLTTGGENILIGWQSGLVITSGFQNIFIGGGAGDSITTGARNTIVGSSALLTNTTGTFNCGFGRNSMRFGATGNENTAIGNDTLQNVTGNRNTALGYQAGTVAVTNTNSVFLGAVTNPAANSGTNEIVIGHNVSGNGSNTSVIGNSSTLNTRLYGNLLLGSNTDSGERLQVTGNAKIVGALDLFSTTAVGAGSDYFYVDNDPSLTAGANNQTIALMRLRDRGSNGAFTGVNRVGIIMENAAGGSYPFQLFSESGNIRIGYGAVASTTTKLSLRGGGNDNTARTLDIENAAGNPVLRTYNGVQVLVGSSTPAASSILQVDSTTHGFLPPRMTTAQKNAIVTPPAGLVIYDTGLNKLCVYTGAAWQTITSA
jgi:hypothetical protein